MRSRHQLLILRDGALRAHGFDGSQAADLDLLLRIGKSLLGKSQRFILHASVLVSVDQVPIDVFDLVDTIDDLQAEGDVGKFAIVFGDANEAGVGRESEALQQGWVTVALKLEFRCRAHA